MGLHMFFEKKNHTTFISAAVFIGVEIRVEESEWADGEAVPPGLAATEAAAVETAAAM